MQLTFPKNFWWGAATSGPQSEGRFHKPHANMFDYWYDTQPQDFYEFVGPDTASDFYHSFRADIQLMKAAGLNSLRTSIQWSRLIADFETATPDPDGVRFYNALIDELLANQITPIINLNHFDLPIELYQRYHGWENKHVTDLFAAYAEQCFKLFGDRVTNWFTFNEPLVMVDGQYLSQYQYPKLVDGHKAVQVAYNLSLASAKAIAKYRQLDQHNQGKIGIILNLAPIYPATQEPADLAAAHMADLWVNQLFLGPAIKGQFAPELVAMLRQDGVLWESTPDELALIQAQTIDQLGVNYYQPLRVQRPDVSPDSLMAWRPSKYYRGYQLPGRVMNLDKGWEIYPRGLYDIAITIRDQYDNIPWYVSENGIGVHQEERFLDAEGLINDAYRIKFMAQHLAYLHQGIAAGTNCHGYHVWTPIDCWSWANAYRNRYGLIRNEIHTQTKTLKRSAYWFHDLSQNNGFSLDQ
ncbi:glycoside hydrolase family 1 protein [Lapidilactobacillus achengensis]|uniref:Glycoside hydrolase family 1 protein n=1 Tax=Lapidilactobacillus achengensis TaxID=2486000 RepID=A0ABW1URM1_9LACO|nr:glycoside hydrolase family 1 protein [Lapidilactobacillus achengensis]